MKLHLNLSLRRALLAAMAVATTLASSAWAGVADSRYDLQYYLDFCRNKGIFAAGATNIDVYFKDGSSVQNPTIPIMPNLDGYAWSGSVLQDGTFAPGGGVGLVNPQYVASAHHCGELNVYFLSENADTSVCYTSSGYTSSGSLTYDWNAQRLNKIVTEVTYNPLADYSVLQNLSKNDWIYRLGNGGVFSTDGYKLSVNQNAIGGMVNVDYTQLLSDGKTWRIVCTPRQNDVSGDIRPPLEIGVTAGDSGSPNYVWDDESQQFLFLGFISQGNPVASYGAFLWAHSNPAAVLNFIDSYTDAVSGFSADSTIVWGAQSATTGQGALTQGNLSFTYTGKGSGNTIKDTRGLLFDAEDGAMRTIELQSSVDMGAGSLTFNSGSWTLTEKNAADTFNSAGFVVNSGAELTLKLTATAGEEWRKVGEGTMTIAGEGKNEAVLRVGGGTTKYDVSYDEDGNIIGCSLGNIGETRLNRTGGYAASSVRLEAGSAIIVLMQDGQFKTNSVAGDTFTFGNAGGLLNLNGHDLTWGVINQDGSGVGARIGNKTPLGETTPGLSTFTYTGTGTFAGCFVDEGAGSSAQLAVVYNNAGGGTWKLTGNNSNVGGYTVEKGTLVLEGYNTPHVNMHDAHDWSYATLEGSDVTVKSGATFQLSHHALMTGDVIVEDGASFVMNQAVNADSESIHGSLRQNMVGREITSLVGNVTLHGNTSTMTANVQSSAITKLDGSVSVAADYNWDVKPKTQFVKDGNGILVVTGNVNVPGVQINAGGLVIESADKNNWYYWSIGEQGFLAAKGVEHSDALVNITKDSAGIFALTKDQSSQLNLSGHTNLYIGAWGDVSYGAVNTTEALTAYDKKWLLGGGTGTLTVNFRLTGENDLIIGNDYSSGTVHLTNTQNDFSGEIIIKGSGNKLTFEQGALSANAGVTLTYGNALSLLDVSQLAIVKNAMDGAQGVLALATSDALNMGSSLLSLGADGDFTYTGALTVDSTYRFGGSGNLTVDTALDGTKNMEIDGQGTTGSSVTIARENAFSGAIVAGAGLGLAEQNSTGDISIHVGHADALAAAASVQLQRGAVLHTDGNNITVQNLSAATGSSIRNDGATNSMLALRVTSGVETSIADGVLDGAGIHLLKTGEGALTLAANRSWSGGLTIAEGTVKGRVYADSSNIMVGIGAEDTTIYVDKDGVLELNFRGAATIGGDKAVSSGRLNTTLLPQKVAGTGTIRISAGDNGGTVLFSNQNTGFSGTMEIVDNTRLYIGHQLFESIMNQKVSYNNVAVFNKATIDVKSGSQVRLTNQWIYGPVNAAAVVSEADFIIAGTGFAGADDRSYGNQNNTLATGGLTSGALSIDLGSVINGTVTLADHATIASHSHIVTNQTNQYAGYMYGQVTYGLPEGKLGGTIRGQILGEGKDLTFAGEEGMTITADSANTYRNLIIASSNGHRNDDKFALNLDGGKAVSQTSTALGKGEVTLGDTLILRLAGTGKANNADVVYTYANDMNVGENATLQSHNITNRLTGTVSMSGSTLNLATANGGVLELAGGIDGSGTLNVGAASVVSLGSAVAPLSAESPQFSGSIVAGAGADITLASSSVLASSTAITGTEALTLRFGGAGDYALGGISGASALTLHFDFTNTPTAGDSATWTTLNSSIAAGTTTIELDLNLFNELEQGNYTLISSAGTGTTYQLADTMNGRLNLVTNDAGALVLTVDADNRLYWRTGGSGIWNTTDANWYSDAAAGSTTFSSNANVMLDATGVAADNSSAARETISLSDSVAVGTLCVQESAYELTGAGAITGTSLTVGNGGDLKLSNAGGSTFTKGVVVNDAALTVEGNTVTADVRAEAGGQFSLQKGAGLSGNLTISDAVATISQSTLAGDVTARGNGKLVLESAAVSGARQLRFEEAGVLSASSGVTLSGTFTFAPRQTVLQAEGMSINTGSLSSTAALEVDTLAMSGASLTLTHAAGTTTQIDTITGNGSLNKESAGNLKLGDASLYGLTLKGGGVTTISGTVTVSNHFSLGKETVNLVEGADVTVAHYTSGNTANSQPTQLSIGTGASLTVTGNNDADATNASFLLAHWGSSPSSLKLNGGTLTAEKTSLMMGWDSGATFEATAGTANLKGIRFSAQRSNSESFILGSAESGTARINLGSAGIRGIGTNDKVLLGNGTIGATSDFSITGSGSVAMVATEGSTVFDTDGHKITVSTALTGDGNITKLGEGTLLISGSGSAYAGNIAVNAGALAVDATGKDILTSAASVAVGDGATLDLSALNFTDSSHRISVNTGTHISFADKSTVAFGGMVADTEYGVFDISGGVLEGWTDLSASNFTIDGVRLSDLGRVVLNLGMTGGFSYTIEDGWDLVWNGGESKQAWNQNEANLIWQTHRPDDTTGELVETRVDYKNNDNVVFNSDADLELEGNIRVNKMTVADGVNLKTKGNLIITGALNVGSNVSWSFSGDTSLSFTETQLKDFAALEVGEGATLTMTEKVTGENNISTAFNKVSGAGNVVLNLSTTDNGVGFNFGKITGDITVATGRLQVNTSTFNAASDIYLTTFDSQLVFNGKGTELKNDVVLGASTTIYGNSECTGTISGTISGSTMTLTKKGAGMLTFSGATTLGGLTVNSGTVKLTNAMTLDGTDRLEMNGGTALQLADGASIKRTSNVAAWIRGNFEVLKDASAEFVSVDDVHLNYNNGNGKGSIVLRENSELTMDVAKLNFYTGADITVHENAELKLTKSNVHISNKGTSEAKITASSVGATSGQLYSVGNDKFEVSNAHVKSVAATNTTLGNKLTNSSVENAGIGLMTVNNAGNTLTDIYATSGDLTVLQAVAGLKLDELVVGAEVTAAAYTGATEAEAQEAHIIVNKVAEFAAEAKLNANLTLSSGAKLKVAEGGVALGSTLTLHQGLTLDDTTLQRISVGKSQVLFTGVDMLKLATSETEYQVVSDSDSSILASTYFTNLGSNYLLTYSLNSNEISDGGTLSITMTVPEPATATLSLLALAALAARRRRK